MNENRDGFDVRTLAATFHHGTTLPLHAHPWGQLIFAASGVMQVAAAEASWLVPTTRAIWMPAGTAHGIHMQGEVAMRTLYLDARRAATLPEIPRIIEVPPLLRELILHILAIGMLDPHQPAHDRLGGLLLDLLQAARTEDLMLPLPTDPRALRLARRWLSTPDEGSELARLADEAGASLRTLQRLFPAQTGLTLEGWRQKARLIHAVARLSTGASVAAAALDSGYASPSSLSAAFMRQFGQSPGHYRARMLRSHR